MDTLRIDNIVLKWPAVYKAPTAIPSTIPARHSVSFEVTEELIAELAEHGIAPKFNERLNRFFFHARSAIAPLVTPRGDDFDKLVRAIQIAQARNMVPDVLLRDLSVDLRVRLFDYAYNGHKGRGMSIDEIIADEDEMLRAAIRRPGWL